MIIDAVADAKKLLFNVSGGTPVQRRGEDRSKTELKDILQQFRLMDDNETILASSWLTVIPQWHQARAMR